MNGFSLLLCFFLLIAFSIFFIGLLTLGVGIFLKRPSWVKNGATLSGVPVAGLVLVLLFSYAFHFFATKPSKEELVGLYEIIESKGLVSPSQYRHHTIELKKDGSFQFKPPSSIEICETGSYKMDYEQEGAELLFRCPHSSITAQINGQFGKFIIEFIVGDPDGYESIQYEKVK